MDANQTYNLVLIPLFPLLGAVFNLLFGGWLMRSLGDRLGREVVHLAAIAAVAFSCFFTVSVFGDAMWRPRFDAAGELVALHGQERIVQQVYTWIASGETLIQFELMMDSLSAVMCLVITGVGLLIHIFSVGYMAKDPAYHRYFAYLNLFTASMLILVLGKSMLLMFVGWEGVGVCSYLLIGFWFTDEAKATAGRKAFVMNRIGDFGFLLGMLVIYACVHSLDFDVIRQEIANGGETGNVFVTTAVLGVPAATLACALLFLGCTGKSAQIPLYTWLPDAMAGPTPVSALIHAATMVTAGVYLIVRLNFLFALAPVVMAVIAVVGAVTALFAATIGITQNDIKKVLAYSTVSQLGYMFLAAGMGAWVAAIFHLVTHAFFKACLFLGSGAVIEACHHNQDIRSMGGLRKKMPVTAGTFLVSCLAIAGIPFFSGFFSKDEILLFAYVSESAWSPGINWVTYVLGLVAAACTAFYMFRLYFLTFEGEFRGDHHTWSHHVREYWIMSLPLVVLAFLATVGGFIGYPHALPGHLPHVLHEWLEPITELSASFTSREYLIGIRQEFTENGVIRADYELMFMGISVGVAALGIYMAYSLYRRGPSAEAAAWAQKLGPLYRASRDKYKIDELYHALFVRPFRVLGGICYQLVDQLIVDGLGVSGTAGTVGFVGNRLRIWHNGNVRRYLVVLLLGTAVVLGTVFANPTIVEVGPSKVHPVDAGGLRPTLGPRPVKIEIWGIGTFEIGPRRGEQPGSPPPSQPVEPPPRLEIRPGGSP